MADVSTYKSVTITDLMKRLEFYKSSPCGIQNVVFEYLDEITNGQVDVVDPTSPFVFLLESSAVNTALAVNESLAALRLQYPSLAQTDAELYHHLSDKDYLDRFASPASVTFTVAVQVNDILNKMQYSSDENCYKATFPRDTQFEIDQYTFTLQYPIDIRKYSNGVVKITYDADITSPLDTLSSNVIDYVIRNDTTGVQWLFFEIRLKQFKIESNTFPLQKSTLFKESIPFLDQYYYIRAFYRNNSTSNAWVEMHTTHSDQVFDPFKPTAVIQKYDQYITVSVPPVYLTSNAISGEVRFDLYTTKGDLTVNLANYKPDAFSLSPIAIDEERDLNVYTNVLNTISFYTYSNDIITGGSDGIAFSKLRDRVINSALGDMDIPITNKQLETHVGSNGFELVKEIDTVTNRVFLATQRLPKPTNLKLATSANIGIGSFITNIDKLKNLDTVRYTNDRLTLLSNNLYKSDNGVISILDSIQRAALSGMSKTALVSHVNSNSYLYSPFYYVLDDANEEFEVRAYNLDYPVASDLSFISQNETLQLPVNTGSYKLEKVATGFRLTIVTKSGNFYKQLPDGLVTAQIAYYPAGETRLAFINGVQTSKTDDEERIYTFDLVTNYDINQDRNLCITNAKMFGNEEVDTWLGLDTVFNLFYATSSIVDGYKSDEADALLGKFILPANSAVTTHEKINLKVGSSLKNLWSRSRSMASGEDYKKHTTNVPAFYESDVYEVSPTTGKVITFDASGKIQYNIIHQKGDPVLDVNGNQVYKYLIGDVVTDLNGNPVLNNSATIDKELDILFVDGRHRFVDDSSFVEYNDELVAVLDAWIIDDISEISVVLLEQSRIYFYPKTTLGKVLVYIEDNGQDVLGSEQSFVVDLYVKQDIYNDAVIRAQLEANTIQALDSFIDDTTVNMKVIEDSLKEIYGNSVQSFTTRGLGGDKNYRYLTLASEETRLTLKKVLYQQQDTTLIIKEDVTVNFYKV